MSREQSSILQRPPLRVQTVSQDATIVDQVAFHSGPWPTTRASPQQSVARMEMRQSSITLHPSVLQSPAP